MSFEAIIITGVGKNAKQFKPTVYLSVSKDLADSFRNDMEVKFETMGCGDIFEVSRATAEVIGDESYLP